MGPAHGQAERNWPAVAICQEIRWSFLPALAIVVDKFAQRDFEVPLLGDDMVEIRRFCADRESPGKPSAAENGAGRAYGFPSSAVAAAALQHSLPSALRRASVQKRSPPVKEVVFRESISFGLAPPVQTP